MKKRLQELFAVTDHGAGQLLYACLTGFLVYVAELSPLALMMYYIKHILAHQGLSLTTVVLGLVLVAFVTYVFIYLDYNATYTTTYQESADLRIDIAETLQKLPLSYFSQRDLTDLSQTLMSDVERLEHALSHAVSKTIGFVIYFILLAVTLCVVNLPLGLSIFSPILAAALALTLSKNMQKKAVKKYWKQLRENSDSFQEAIELQEEIKAYNLTDTIHDKLYRQMEKSEKTHIISEILQGIPISFSNSVIRLTIGLVILVGTNLYFQHQVSLLVLLMFILLAIKASDSVEDIVLNVGEILYIDSAVKNIKELRAVKQQAGQDVTLSKFDIELKNVGFAYKDGQKVIDGVSFVAKQNEITALVGPSGCGKTTLLRLLSRLYDYQEGQITIDGKDIQQISTNSLFDYISIVFQDVTLFDNTILENIRLGRPDASDDEVKQAAYLANCQEFIEKLPQGYETKIGENGAKLSGGERQRLSIARAILKQAPIVILDEITSSLDIENEKMIQESLNYLLKDKTVIIISHRLKSIENADKIVVMKAGQIDGIGKHQDLLEKSAVYRDLIETSQKIEDFKYQKNV